MPEMFVFPTDSIGDIEKKFVELNSRWRRGDDMDEVELTWMDQANVVLIEYYSIGIGHA